MATLTFFNTVLTRSLTIRLGASCHKRPLTVLTSFQRDILHTKNGKIAAVCIFQSNVAVET